MPLGPYFRSVPEALLPSKMCGYETQSERANRLNRTALVERLICDLTQKTEKLADDSLFARLVKSLKQTGNPTGKTWRFTPARASGALSFVHWYRNHVADWSIEITNSHISSRQT